MSKKTSRTSDKGLWSRFQDWLRSSSTAQQYRTALSVEPLEDRTLLSVSAAFNPTLEQVTFESQGLFTDDDLFLRATNGILEHSSDGVNFSQDVDSNQAGVQSLALSDNSTVLIDVSGDVTIQSMDRAGGTFRSLDNLFIQNASIISTRDLAQGSSQGDSLNITFQAPEIVVGENVVILAQADNGHESGDVQIIANNGYDRNIASEFPLFKVREANARVEIRDGVQIQAGNIRIVANSDVIKSASFAVDEVALNLLVENEFLANTTGMPGLEFDDNGTAGDTITRDQGNWIADGFEVGQIIQVIGTSNNDGTYLIGEISSDGTTLTVAGFDALDDEVVAPGGASVVQILALLTENPELTFSDNGTSPDTITRATGSWIADGFQTGQLINVDGTEINDDSYRVASVTDTVLTLAPEAVLFDQGPITDVTINEVFEGVPLEQVPLVVVDENGESPLDQNGDILATAQFTAGQVADALSEQVPNALIKGVGIFEDFLGLVQGVIAAADSEVLIGAATLNADNRIDVEALSSSNVTLSSPSISLPIIRTNIGFPVGFGVGSSEADSIAIVGDGATINADLFNLKSNANNTLSVTITAVAGSQVLNKPLPGTKGLLPGRIQSLPQRINVPAPTLSLAFGQAETESEAVVQGGAVLNVGDAFVTASNTNNFDVTGGSKILFPEKNLGEGVTVAVSVVESESEAHIDGTVNATGTVGVESRSINQTNNLSSTAVVKEKLPKAPGKLALAVKNGGTGFMDVLQQQNEELVKEAGQVGFSAAIGFVVSNNDASAWVGDDATITTGGNLSISSEAEDNFTTLVNAGAKASQEVGLGGAVIFSSYENDASSHVGKRAWLNVGGDLIVQADARVPHQAQIIDDVQNIITTIQNFQLDVPAPELERFLKRAETGVNNVDPLDPATFELDLVNPAPYFTETFTAGAQDLAGLVGAFTPLLGLINSKLGIPNKFATTYTTVSAKGTVKSEEGAVSSTSGKFAFAGSASVLNVENESEAFIDEGAQITVGGGVSILSNASVDTVNIVGMASALSLFKKTFSAVKGVDPKTAGVASAGSAIGGHLIVSLFDNDSHAWIGDGVVLRAQDKVQVEANTRAVTVGLAQAGANVGGDFGAAGAIAFHKIDNDALAWIEDTASVTTLGDLEVDADTNLIAIDLAFVLENGGKVGIGASIVTNVYENTTHAFIGNRIDSLTFDQPGSITADNVLVEAENLEVMVSLSLAGAKTEGGGSAPTPPSNDDPLDGISLPSLFGDDPQEDVQTTTGVGISGDVAVNVIEDDVQAWISDGMTVNAANDLTIRAESDAILVGSTVAFAIVSGTPPPTKAVSIAGSLISNTLIRKTHAFTEDVDITAGNVLIDASSTDRHLSVSAGGAAAPVESEKSVAVAGSVNLHVVVNYTVAALGDQTRLISTGDVTVEAENVVQFASIAGAVAVAGQVGVGAAIDLASVANTAQAFIGAGSDVQAQGNVTIEADNTETIIGLAGGAAATKKLGIAGTGALQLLVTTAEAWVEDGATVHTEGNVLIDADDRMQVITLPASAGLGKDIGIGASVANVDVIRTVRAYVGDNASVTAKGHGDPDSDGAKGIVIEAEAEDVLVSLAASAGVANNTVGVAASGNIVIVVSNVEAFIGENARVNEDNDSADVGQSVQVIADHDSIHVGLAGGVGISTGTSGVGAAVDTRGVGKVVKAYVDDSAVVNAENNVVVEAESRDRVLSLVASIAAASNGGAGAGSLSIITLNNETQAFIGDNAIVTAEGNVVVSAFSDAQIVPFTGAGGFSNGAGVGAAGSTVIKTDVTEAWIGNGASVDARGNRDAIAVNTAERPVIFFEPDTTDIKGVSVTAVSFEDVLSASIGAGGGGGNVGVGGSVALNVLVEQTRAWIGEDAKINQRNDNAGADQSVNLLAADQTTIVGVGGSLGIGNTVGVGAGIDVGVITKFTEAEIKENAQVNANRNVLVQAEADQKLLSAALTTGLGSNVGVAGGLGIGALGAETRAIIHAGAEVDSDGNVLVAADADTFVVQLTGNVSASNSVAVGASLEGLVLVEITEAYVDDGAKVNARGNHEAIQAQDGGFDVDFLGLTTLLDQTVGVPQINNTDIIDPSVTGIRRSSATTRDVKGLAVTANSQNDVHKVALGGGLSAGAAGVSLVGSINVSTIFTRAYVGDNVEVNVDDLLVAAGSDYSNVSLVGTAALSQSASVGPALDLNVLVMETDAHVGDSSIVNANGDVLVSANAIEDSFSLAAGVTLAAGQAAVAGASSVLFLKGNTTAYVGENAIVTAEGNLLVQAQDRTDGDIISGSGAVGIAVGVGGSFALTPIIKNTEAYVSQGAQVTAKGNSSETIAVAEGDWTDDDPTTKEIKGLGVQALSKENLFTVTVSGGGSGYVNVAGSLSATLVRSTTSAYLAETTLVNADNTGASSEQSVSVAATNDVDILTISGSAGIAAQSVGVGVSGSIDLGLVLNETTAYVGNGSSINVNQDLDVRALAKWDIISFVISGSLGIGEVAVGVAGAASLIAIGAGYNDDARNSMTAQDGSGSAADDLDTQMAVEGTAPVEDQAGNVSDQPGGTALYFDALGNYATQSTDADGNVSDVREGIEIQNVRQQLIDGLPQNVVTSQVDSTDVPAGTSAFIGSQVNVRAGRHVTLDAQEEIQAIQAAGGAGIGAGLFSGGAGGAVAITLIGSNVQAYIDGNSTIEAALIDSTGDVTIRANFEEEVVGSAFAFGGGLFFGLGAQAVAIVDVSEQQAYVGAGSEVRNADQVNVHAGTDQNLNAATLGAAVGGVGLAGSVANVTTTGDTLAYVAEQAKVGTTEGQSVNHLDVRATSGTAGNALAGAAAVGGAGAAGSLAFVTDERTTEASIDSNAEVEAQGNVIIDAISDDEFTLLSGQVAVGPQGGVGVANSNLVHLDTTRAIIDTGAKVTANGNRGTTQVDTGKKAGGNEINGDTFVDELLADFPPGSNNDNRLTQDVRGLSVGATSYEDVAIVAVGAASGGQNVAIAGSLTLTVLTEDTEALIASGALINEDNSKANQNQSVRIKASDRTRFLGAGGGFAGGSSTGLGAGLDVLVIDKSTTAAAGIGSSSNPMLLNAERDVIVEAISEQDVLSTAAAGSLLDATGLAGALGAQTLLIDTQAFVGSNSVVSSEGNVVITADNDDDLLILDINLNANALAGIGAAIAVTVLEETTEAFIAQGAIVHAKGNRPGILARDGNFGMTTGEHQGLIGDVLDQKGNDDTQDSSFSQLRKTSANEKLVLGLAVTATSQYDAIHAALAGSASSGAATLGAAITVADVTTSAYVGNNARINQDNTGAGSNQDVLVAAGSDYSSIGITGSVGIGGINSIGGAALSPALDLNVVNLTTEAWIGDDARVDALDNIDIIAESSQDFLTVAIGLALSGGQTFALSLAGSLSVVNVNNRTSARVGKRSRIEAGGNLRVSAFDATEADIITGAGALAAGPIGAAVGGSLAVTPIQKTTEAYIDQGAIVTAGEIAVLANSREDVFTASASGALSNFAGLAGAVTVNLIDSDTSAYLAENVDLTARNNLNVIATSDVDLRTFVGSAGGGLFGGIAGGVDVGIVRNDTSAFIGNGSTVNVQQSAGVQAISRFDAESTVVSVAAGLVGLGGAASTYIIGGNLDPNARDSITAQDGSSDTVGSYANSQAGGEAVLDVLDNYSSQDKGGAEVLQVRNRIRGRLAGQANDSGNALDATVIPSGTTAFVGDNVQLQVRSDLNVFAGSDVDLDQTVGGAALGAVSFGGSVVVGLVEQSTDAHIGQGSTVTAGDNGLFLTGGDVTVQAQAKEDLQGSAFAGAIGGSVSLAAQGVFYNDNSQQAAYLDRNAEIIRARSLEVSSTANRNVGTGNPFDNEDNQSITAALGFGLTVGVAIADVDVSGSTVAELRDGVKVGQNDSVRSASIVADSNVNANANTFAVAAGVGIAGAVNNAQVDVDPTVEAKVGRDAQLKFTTFSGPGLELRAVSQANADVSTNGISVATVSVGRNDARATISPDVTAKLGEGAEVRGNGSVSILAAHNYDTLTEQATGGKAQASAGPSGSDEDADDVSNAAGGVITFLGANADAVSDADVTSAVGEGALIDISGTFDLKARSSNHADANGDGIQVGLLAGFGQISAEADARGDTRAVIESSASNPTTVRVNGLFNNAIIDAQGESRAEAEAEAAGGGLFSGIGAESDADVNTDVVASVGDNATFTAGGTIQLRAESKELAEARSEGVNVGGITISNSDADANVFADVEASVGRNATISAGQDLTLEAIHNPIGNNSDAFSRGSVKGGGSIVGLSDTIANARTDVDALATARQGAELNANRNVTIEASSTADTDTDATNRHSSAIAIGNTQALAGVNNDPRAILESDVTVTAGEDFRLLSSSTVTGSADADEIGESIFSDAESNAFMISYHSPLSRVGDNVTVVAGEALVVDSVSSTDTKAAADVEGDSLFLADPDARAYMVIGKGFSRDGFNPLPFSGAYSRPQHLTDSDDFSNSEVFSFAAPTRTEIQSGAQLTGNTVELTARVTRLQAEADARSEANGLASNPDAFGEIAALSTVDVNVDSNAEIVGIENVVLRSQYSSGAVRTDIDAFADGNAPSSRAHVAQFTRSIVDTASNSILRTPSLLVESLTPDVKEITRAERDGFDPAGPAPELGSQERDRRNRVETLIDFSSTVTLPGLAAILEIDSAGNVIQQEGITFTDTGATLVVDDVDGSGSSGTVLFRLQRPEGTNDSFSAFANLSGQPVFNFLDYRETIRISNASNKSLEINDISTVAEGLPQVELELFSTSSSFLTDPTNPTFPVSLFVNGFNAGVSTITDDELRTIDIDQTGLGDVFLNGFIDNPLGETSIVNTGGIGFFGNHDILATSPDALILSNRIELDARFGTIGTVQNRIATELVRGSFFSGVLTASARDDVVLQVSDRLRDAAGPFNFNTPTLQAGNDINLDVLQGAGGSIYFGNFTAGNDIIITAQDSSLNATTDLLGDGSINVSTDGSVTLTESNGDLRAGAIVSRASTLRLTSQTGNIVDADNDPQIDAIGGQVFLSANQGVGSTDNALEIDSTSLFVSAGTDVNVTEAVGNLNLNQVHSRNGDVTLTATNGSIRDDNASFQFPAGDVIGNHVTLTSDPGSIGTVNDAIEIDSTRLTAQARGRVNVTELNGNLNVDRVISETGNVRLGSIGNGSILDANSDGDLNVQGVGIELQSLSRSIGTASNALEIQGEQLNAIASQNVHVTDVTGDLLIDNVTANTGDVSIIVESGTAQVRSIDASQGNATLAASDSVLDANGDNLSNVNAQEVDLTATTGTIGTQANAFEIDSTRLRSFSEDSTSVVELTGDLNVERVESESGDVTLTAVDGNVNLESIVARQGTANVTALGSILDVSTTADPGIDSEAARLTATTGSIGQELAPVEITSELLNAQALQSVHLRDVAGDLSLEVVTSLTGDVSLETAGSLLDVNNDDVSDVNGRLLTLQAGQNGIGSIGTEDQFLQIESEELIASTTAGGIHLNEVTGDLNVTRVIAEAGNIDLLALDGVGQIGLVETGQGNVSIVAGDAIVDALDDNEINVRGTSVDLTSLQDAIGSTDNPFDVATSQLAAFAQQDVRVINDGDVALTKVASVEGNVILTNSTGSALVGQVEALQGRAVLIAQGDILELGADAAADVESNDILLVSQQGSIGTSTDDLEINTAANFSGTITAFATEGIFLTETSDNLIVHQVASTSGDVRLTVNDSSASGDDLLLTEGNLVAANGGSVILRAGDNVLLSGTLVSAGPLTVVVDFNNADPGVGGEFEIEKPVSAPSMIIAGNTDSDRFVFEFANGSPIPLGGITLFGDQPVTAPGDVIVIDGNGASLQIVLDGNPGQGNGIITVNARDITFFSIEFVVAVGPSIFTFVTADFNVLFAVEGLVFLESQQFTLATPAGFPLILNVVNQFPEEEAPAPVPEPLARGESNHFLMGGRTRDLDEEVPEWLQKLIDWLENLITDPSTSAEPENADSAALGDAEPPVEETTSPTPMSSEDEDDLDQLSGQTTSSDQEQPWDAVFEHYEEMSVDPSDVEEGTEEGIEQDLAFLALAAGMATASGRSRNDRKRGW